MVGRRRKFFNFKSSKTARKTQCLQEAGNVNFHHKLKPLETCRIKKIYGGRLPAHGPLWLLTKKNCQLKLSTRLGILLKVH